MNNEKEYTSEDLVRMRGEESQEIFAEKLGISRELLSKMENGKKKISKATQILLRDIDPENITIVDQLPAIIRDLYERIIRLESHAEVYGYRLTRTAKELSDLNDEIKEIANKRVDELRKKQLGSTGHSPSV